MLLRGAASLIFLSCATAFSVSCLSLPSSFLSSLSVSSCTRSSSSRDNHRRSSALCYQRGHSTARHASKTGVLEGAIAIFFGALSISTAGYSTDYINGAAPSPTPYTQAPLGGRTARA